MVRTVSALKASVLAALLLCDGHLSAACEGVAVQVLGSGGPEIGDKRASSAYLVWQNGRARALIDMGAGAALRFGRESERSRCRLVHPLSRRPQQRFPRLHQGFIFHRQGARLAGFRSRGQRAHAFDRGVRAGVIRARQRRFSLSWKLSQSRGEIAVQDQAQRCRACKQSSARDFFRTRA